MFFDVLRDPIAFLEVVRPYQATHERKLNIVLPHAQKLARQLREEGEIARDQFWVVAWSSPSGGSRPTLEFVLSCTEHHLGTYPLFLVLLRPVHELSDAWLEDKMASLAERLANELDPARVFSIFGQERPTIALCRHWAALTGADLVQQPYYEASSSYCTRQTLASRNENKDRSTEPLPRGHVMRLATQPDLDAVAQLCQEFAEDSPPFTLTGARARKEAQYLITHGYVSVYTIDGIVTTIVAVTRSSSSVAGMTKVYTTPRYRGRGCAENLVAHVCQSQLDSGLHSVVLYVGHALSAARVYHRVGFVGVGPGKSSKPIPDAENWLELGFRNTRVGHW